jgi:tetratricopeptide (TPR) repeat protein
MGGYAALRFGSTDSLARAIFAISPHLVLDRPRSRSAQVMRGPVSPRDADVRPFLEGKNDKKIFLAFSCLDVLDGVQVKDSLTLHGPNFTKIYLLESHYLASVHNPSNFVEHWIKYRNIPEISMENIASKEDIQDCMLAYEIMLSTVLDTSIDLNQINLSSRLPQYYYWIGRYLYGKKQFLESLSWFVRGIGIAKKFNLHLAEIMISYGNALNQAGFHEPALGCYRHFREHQPPVKTAFLCEAYLLKQLGRPDELRTALNWYENRFGTDEISIQVQAML